MAVSLVQQGSGTGGDQAVQECGIGGVRPQAQGVVMAFSLDTSSYSMDLPLAFY